MFEGGYDMSESGKTHDDLETLLAAEEAAIADAGFSTRVMASTRRAHAGRRVTLYAAGMIGFGVAAGSLSEAASRSQAFQAWAAEARRLLQAPDIPEALPTGDASLIMLAGAIGLLFAVAALFAPSR
jgi:hypothetical protein